MKNSVVTAFAMIMTLLPSTVMAYGEGEDISMDARAIHLLTNEARTNTREALALCGDNCSETIECYAETLPPLYWDDGLYKAAQFHANMLSYITCMQHDSPCTLVSTVASDFPDTCDGNPTCACVEKSATCGSVGTQTYSRIQMFASQPNSENLASAIGAVGSFELWIYEDGNGSGCEFTPHNGHRWNILSSSSKFVGVGYASYIASQDFGLMGTKGGALSSGAHYAKGGSTWFKTHYYASNEVSKVTVKFADQCVDLSKTRGTLTNGVWGTSDISASGECVPYFFEAKDASGTITRYPTTGSLLYNCGSSWSSTEETSCFAAGDGGTGENTGDNGNGENTGDNGNGENTGDNGNGEHTGDNGNGEHTGDNGNGENTGDDGNGENTGDNGNGEGAGNGNKDDMSPSNNHDDGCNMTLNRSSQHGMGFGLLAMLCAMTAVLRRRKA